MNEVTEALTNVLEQYVRYLNMLGRATVEADPQWASPCEVGELDAQGMVRWQPVAMDSAPDFSDVEVAINEPLHPDIRAFYGSYWAGNVQAKYGKEIVLLHTVWNPQDLDRKNQALIEHVLARREVLGGSATIPIANTDGDLFFSVDNLSGEVLLEEPGYPPQGVIAASLREFLAALRIGGE